MPEGPDADAAGALATPRSLAPTRWLRGFWRFWWDFLVGDTPELFVGSVAIIVAVALVAATHAVNAVAVVALPLLVALLLSWSVRRGWRQR